MSRGRLIVFEGGEGTGKSTQAQLLANDLDALLTRQPGGTDLGRQIREIVLSSDDNGLTDRAEALLMAADRAHHVETVIEPALAAGRDVVCDRFIGSTVAYQGYGRGLDVDMVRAISGWAAGGLWPDVTILLTVPQQVADARRGATSDRIEAAGAAFHQRVLDGFLAQADDDDDNWITVDGSGSIEEVRDLVHDALFEMLRIEL